jgi:predicted permease
MNDLLLDLRYAVRTLRNAPGFAVAAVVTLALGIGATTAIFSVVHQVLLRDLPYDDAGRLVIIWENDRIRGTEREFASYPDYEDLAAESESYAALSATQQRNRTLSGHGADTERVIVAAATASYFDVLGVDAAVGRTLTAADQDPDAPPVALIGDGLWRTRFGADSAVVGQSVRIDGSPHTVIGILPPEAALPGTNGQLWVPLVAGLNTSSIRGMHNTFLLGRLRAGVTRAAAQIEAETIMARLEDAYPDDNLGRSAWVADLRNELIGDARAPLLILLTAVGAVLLIACANVANLLLARATVREQELAIRAALGSGRARLVRQLLTESLVLGILGGAAGVALAFWGIDALRGLAPGSIPGIGDATIDAAVLGFTAAASLLSVAVFGLAPALRAASVAPGGALAAGVRAGGRRAGHRARHLLMAGEAALAVVLVVGAALLIRSFAEMRGVDPGYRPAGLITLQFQLPEATYPPPEVWPWLEWPRATQVHTTILDRVRALPGVRSAGLGLNGPATGGWTTRVSVEGRPPVPEGELDEAAYWPVSWDYLGTLGVPLRRGRMLEPRDRLGAPLVVLVNEAFVRRHFPDEDPLGHRIMFFGNAYEVVGVVGDIRSRGLLRDARPTFYPPLAQNPWGTLSLVARTDGEPAALEPALRAILRDVDPEVAVFGVAPVGEQVAGSIAQERFTTLLLAIFAGLALVLACVGVYGVVAYTLAQHTREFGIRIALGADRRQVVLAAMGRGLSFTIGGVAVGLILSLATGRLLQAQLYGIGPTDLGTYASAGTVLLGVALLATYLPARRATRVAPTDALRQE